MVLSTLTVLQQLRKLCRPWRLVGFKLKWQRWVESQTSLALVTSFASKAWHWCFACYCEPPPSISANLGQFWTPVLWPHSLSSTCSTLEATDAIWKLYTSQRFLDTYLWVRNLFSGSTVTLLKACFQWTFCIPDEEYCWSEIYAPVFLLPKWKVGLCYTWYL